MANTNAGCLQLPAALSDKPAKSSLNMLKKSALVISLSPPSTESPSAGCSSTADASYPVEPALPAACQVVSTVSEDH
eukprot:CAMPEP_0115124454 /NCGR_PEP_ID=MMETSP0227-20121206/48329_1 /TAXON_ID=89957 /ORGANISM="Polarella glacialis, Strain CCMP 1383" /LENGTH=76 /DNA_ID=CAMNT_0002527383 /DNA_START=69 /DNA_END=296 /DNA_ORIENTATION=-